jgi:predicted amino acid-binding ACT domain protein
MGYTIRRVDYFKVTVKDQPGEAYKLLSLLAELGVNLIAISLIPIGPMSTQMTLFPEESAKLTTAAVNARLHLDGPQRALMIQGDDVLGALVEIHAKLAAANVNVFASNGLSDGQGHYCYILHVRREDYERAAHLLEV